ncbi:MAG: hypothetical protein HZA22_01150 [Nitrospirae bacterium]|nr:hypothetical protein [Nitrospirota bacterium]
MPKSPTSAARTRKTITISLASILLVLLTAVFAWPGTVTVKYTYDTAYQITKAKYVSSDATLEYVYDNIGNRLNTTVTSGTVTNTPPAQPSAPTIADYATGVPVGVQSLGWWMTKDPIGEARHSKIG